MILEKLYAAFRENYPYLGSVTGREIKDQGGILFCYELASPDLRAGNGPRIFHHGKKTDHVIILTHGLSDSPRYVEDVGKCFYHAGLNVVLPLLPGHGLVDPDRAFEDKNLDTCWRQKLDQTIELASRLGEVISLGGFSTGGALSYNRILRDMEKGGNAIQGGLFLFSAAIKLIPWSQFLIDISSRVLIKKLDDNLKGKGPDPYKYPVLPKFGAKELVDIIEENDRLSKEKKLEQPVFAAHFLLDDTADVAGVLHLLRNHAVTSSAFIIGEAVNKIQPGQGRKNDLVEWANVAHASIPLREPIQLVQHLGEVLPNPQFDLMMRAGLDFFETEIAAKVFNLSEAVV